MGVPNYLIFCVLVLLVIVVSHVECGAQECETSKTGSTYRNVLNIDDEMLELVGPNGNKRRKQGYASIHSSLKPSTNEPSKHAAPNFNLNNKETQQIIDRSLSMFNGVTGPTNTYQKNGIPIGKTETVIDPETGETRKVKYLGPKCIACRINCLKMYDNLGRIFAKCEKQFYYYGCRKRDGCPAANASTDDKIMGMIGICLLRNGCELVNQWQAYETDLNVRKTLVSKIRKSNEYPDL